MLVAEVSAVSERGIRVLCRAVGVSGPIWFVPKKAEGEVQTESQLAREKERQSKMKWDAEKHRWFWSGKDGKTCSIGLLDVIKVDVLFDHDFCFDFRLKFKLVSPANPYLD
ncbi:hypothetical protein KIPB_010513 [Kipferlia bialata]|uniref:Uncharacterized protein n=1 Tax=Kipferlia bialata TaxID=797122 RepID=A0A9K3D598_9EUKA|nr:hypothetical protein KIPB_010513 [Kipferlia bialata]|eukprot:g10513.t1